MPWKCYWMDDTGEVHVRLRRYVSSDQTDVPCPGGYHQAMSEVIARQPNRANAEGYLEAIPVEEYQGNPSWPKRCAREGCDYRFKKADQWQVWTDRIYRRAATGEEFDAMGLPPGSLLDGHWHPQKGPDGIALVVVLPPSAEDTRGHWWHADGPSSNAREQGQPGPSWTRTGDPRHPETLTANPSILTDDYHGFLQAGFLTDSLGDRPLPPGPDG